MHRYLKELTKSQGEIKYFLFHFTKKYFITITFIRHRISNFYLSLITIVLFIFSFRMEISSWIAILGANVSQTGYWAPNLMDVVNGYLESVAQRLSSSLSIILQWIRRLIQGILIHIRGGVIDIPLWSKENSNNQ